MHPSSEVDTVIIGGGIVGAMLAHACAGSLVIDPGGRNATHSSAAFDAVESPIAAHRALAERGRAAYRTMAITIPEAATRTIATHWADDGRQSCEGIGAPTRLTEAVLRTRSRLRTRVRSIDHGPRVTLDDGHTVHARRVFVAVGAWLLSPPFAALLPSDHGVRTKKVASLVIDVAPEPDAPCTIYDHDGAFTLPDGAQWLYCFTLDAWDCAPDADTLDAAELAQGLAALARHHPEWVAQVSSARVAVDAYTPDRMPLVCAATVPGVTIVGAASGAGYRIAPALAHDALAFSDRSSIV